MFCLFYNFLGIIVKWPDAKQHYAVISGDLCTLSIHELGQCMTWDASVCVILLRL